MDLGNLFDRLDFQDNLFFDDEISAIALVEMKVAINDRYGNLSGNVQASIFKFFCQHCLVDCFQQAGPEFTVHLHTCVHHNFPYRILIHLGVFAAWRETPSGYSFSLASSFQNWRVSFFMLAMAFWEVSKTS